MLPLNAPSPNCRWLGCSVVAVVILLISPQVAVGDRVSSASTINGNEFYACAINKDAKLRCIGENSFGQLGLGSSVDSMGAVSSSRTGLNDRFTSDSIMYTLASLMDERLPVVDLGAGEIPVHVYCHEDTTCVALASNKIVCFGKNYVTSPAENRLGIAMPSVKTIGLQASEMGANLRPVTGIPTSSPITYLGPNIATNANNETFAWSPALQYDSGPSIKYEFQLKKFMVGQQLMLATLINRTDNSTVAENQIVVRQMPRDRTIPFEEGIELFVDTTPSYSTWTYGLGVVSDFYLLNSYTPVPRLRVLLTTGLVYDIFYENNGQSFPSEAVWQAVSYSTPVAAISEFCVLLINGQDIQCEQFDFMAYSISGVEFFRSNFSFKIPDSKRAVSIYATTNSGFLFNSVCAVLDDGDFLCVDGIDPSRSGSAIVLIGSCAALVSVCVVWSTFRWARQSRVLRKFIIRMIRRRRGRQYVAFVSYHKGSARAVATVLTTHMENELGNPVFLDSESLTSVADIRVGVRDSLVLLACQTKEYLYRPWCLVELYEAIISDIPIVPVILEGQGYDFSEAYAYLTHPNFKNELEIRNPGAVAQLEKYGLDVTNMGLRIGQVLPDIISKPFDLLASSKVRRAQLREIHLLAYSRIGSRKSSKDVAVADVAAKSVEKRITTGLMNGEANGDSNVAGSVGART